jgi:uncharacterized protein YndB with AHSA1/START domain
MNITTEHIDRPVEATWKIFTQANLWKDWWGGDLVNVQPGWEVDADLVWAEGPSSTIVKIWENRELLIRDRWVDTLFRFSPEISPTTAMSIGFVETGARFADGGFGEMRLNRERLEKFKAIVEKLVPA